MDTETKRQLLAQVLSGDREALQVYQAKQAQQQSADLTHHLWIIDNRECGGTIEGSDSQEWTLEQLEAYPFKNCVWVMRDYSGGERTPEPDEDYHTLTTPQ